MLTSPAVDDIQGPSKRRHNMYNRNCFGGNFYEVTEKQGTSRQNHKNNAVLHQDGNVNANTFVHHHGSIVEGFNNVFQGHNDRLHVKDNFNNGKCMGISYKDSTTKKSKEINQYNGQGWISGMKNEQYQPYVNMFDRSIGNTSSFHELYSSQYQQSYDEPLKKLTQSDSNLFQRKSFNHDAQNSAFKKANQSNVYTCQDLEQSFDNIFDAQYQTDTNGFQGTGSFDLLPEVDSSIQEKFFVHRGNNRNESEPLDQDKRSTNNDSLCSVTSDETESFEIIDWNENDSTDISDQLQLSKAYITPSTSPHLDLSHLQDYHTAPGSPDDSRDEIKSVKDDVKIFTTGFEDLVDEFFVVSNQNDNYEDNEKVLTIGDKQASGIKNVSESQKDDSMVKSETGTCEVKHCAKCGKVIKKEAKSELYESKTSAEKVGHKEIETTQPDDTKTKPPPEPSKPVVQRREGPRLQLQTPPFISVDSLLYEADPESGSAKIIGRGSFGQVYKVRFSDPNYYHLPVVVKEFFEEFSNSRDIIEEAQRLYYLQDTGYVPICYGLLCFSDANRPKYGIVQEYVGTGLTLEQMLWDQYQFPVEVWLSISYQCCDGLARFHEKGILLNDIKTNNIIMDFRHNTVKIKFIDFGLATDMRGKRYKNTKSLDNYVYLAPEVRKHGQWTNIASDIYSLGYMLGQLYNITGLNVLEVISNLSMDKDPEMRLPVQGASSLIHDSIIKYGFDPGLLCINI